jgi:predicted RNA methylase
MAIQIDPEGNEIAALLDLAGDFTAKNVLEIGSGDGRLTWRYAEWAGHVIGIEPKAEKTDLAEKNMPASLRGRVEMRAQDLSQFAAEVEASKIIPARFDLAILSWSL